MDLARIEGLIAAQRERLRARYGWTQLELNLTLEPGPPARLELAGTIAVASLAGQLRRLLEPELPEGVGLALELRPLPIRAWYGRVPGRSELWAEHPSLAPRSLATQLGEADGPVALLAQDGQWSLVCARDGTVGWLQGGLGEKQAARVLTPPKLLAKDPGAAIAAAALDYLGVPYLLGGNGREVIDCSGLVQRALLGALELLVPRNSNDQLAIAGGGHLRERVLGRPGDLIFIRSRRMQRTHVGIVSAGGAVVHASRSRGAVIEQSGAEFEGDAEWIRWVGWEQVVAWSRGQVGRTHVALPHDSVVF